MVTLRAVVVPSSAVAPATVIEDPTVMSETVADWLSVTVAVSGTLTVTD
jgi:hypothetical protein